MKLKTIKNFQCFTKSIQWINLCIFIFYFLRYVNVFYLHSFLNLSKKTVLINQSIFQSIDHPLTQSPTHYIFPDNPKMLLITPNLLLPYPKTINHHPQLFRYCLPVIKLSLYLCFIILKPYLLILYRLLFQILINSPTLSVIEPLW